MVPLPESKAPVYTYGVDFERHDVSRNIKKETFKIKPFNYIESASDGSLPLEIQAAFQAARPVLETLRETRMLVTKSLTKGLKGYRVPLGRLLSFELSLEDFKGSPFLRRIYLRYVRYCLSEVKQTKRLLYAFCGMLPQNYYRYPYGETGRRSVFDVSLREYCPIGT